MHNVSLNNDNTLFADFLTGDMKAYECLFLKYNNVLCAYANQFVDYEAGEEVVQDVMVTMWERRELIDIEGSPLAYMFKCVKNKCLKQIERDSRRVRMLDSLYDNEFLQIDDPDFYIAEELKRKINLILEEMPSTFREAFEMNRFQDMTYQQIADKLNVSPKTVDYRIQKALKILRKGLRDYLPLLSLFLQI